MPVRNLWEEMQRIRQREWETAVACNGHWKQYKHTNTLYKLHMTGAQLKKYMEWSANYYNTFRPGDLTISFNPAIRAYNYDMFEGVLYDVDISAEPGSRIRNLTWPDGAP